jgi:quinol monooxygenase YgiN
MAIGKTASFQVRPETIEASLEAIAEFTREVGASEPDTLFYIALQDRVDPARFLHVFAFADERAEDHHRTTPWVKAFTDVLYPNTVDGVTFDDFALVASTTRR